MKLFLIIWALQLIFCARLMAEGTPFSISFGPVKLGESRIPINLHDFEIIKKDSSEGIFAAWVKDSVQWVRTENNLLTPRARMGFKINSEHPNIHFKYAGKTILPERRSTYYYAEIYVNLFNPGDLFIHKGKNRIATVGLRAKTKKRRGKAHVIDYSCSRYNLVFEGLEDEFMSLGCRMERRGRWGKEKPRLEVTWATTNYRLLDGTTPPYTSFINDTRPIKMTLVDNDGVKRVVTIRAALPKRLRRFKSAIGFGPYQFETRTATQTLLPRIAPAAMLYTKLDLTNSSSLRAFDALVYNKSLFNNFGLYFAYDLADAFDGRLLFVPLLGAQGLTFRMDKNDKNNNLKFIYPQGFEVVYKHAFGFENYNFIYGMFPSPSSDITYRNLWARFGKGMFWEVNYIEYQDGGDRAKMYGLSIGLPFLSFF